MENNTTQRLRIIFQDTGILNKSQKKNGLKRSWVLLKPEFHTISDIVSHIWHSFQLHYSCPYGIILSMDGYVLPPFESTTILKDNDLISVKRKGKGKIGVLKATEDTRPCIEGKTVEEQPLPLGVRLLANEGFDEETRGNEIDKDKDEDEAKEPVQSAPGGNLASKKRKASSSIESSKKKRKCQVTPKNVKKKDINQCDRVQTPQKKRKLASGHKHEGAINCTKKSERISNELEEKSEDVINASGVPKKVSRSTRRKKRQRNWRNSGKTKEDKSQDDNQLPVKDLGKDLGSEKDLDANIKPPTEEDSDADDALVPVEIRPGHIRFSRSSKAIDVGKNQEVNGWEVQATQKCAEEDHTVEKNEWDVNKYKVTKESFCWNGITNKKKGQKWGKENQPWKDFRDYNGQSSSSRPIRNQYTPSWKDRRDHNTYSSGTWASRKRPNNDSMDFEKLAPLIDLPKVGDVIAYRLLELSSTWCPELSSFRVGKIACFEQESDKITVVPEAEYPLNLEKKTNNDQDGDYNSGQPPQPSLYNEDGSLEIDFPSLVDVRIVKRADPSPSVATGNPAANGTSVPTGMNKGVNKTEDGSKDVASDAGNQEPHTPAAPENGKKDVWEEISDALSAKKAQLLQEDSWNKKPASANRSWSNRTLKSSALGPTMARLRAQNGV